jgi:hypothetical protein
VARIGGFLEKDVFPGMQSEEGAVRRFNDGDNAEGEGKGW